MNSLEYVAALRDDLTTDGKSKPEIIRQLAEACLGWPYVFGAWGEECTPANRKKRVRADHPTVKSACPALNGGTCEQCKWGIGVRMFDCRGFTRWLLQQVGLDITGQGATSQFNTVANWAQRGKISELPDCVCCVFQQSGKTMQHTGMHIGGGRIIHCSNGVQTGDISNKAWTHWAVPVGLYSEGEMPVITVKPILRKGSRGDEVKELQEQLNHLGYDCGTADGVFGTKTYTAVMHFQRDNGLTADGIVGQKTWAALDAAESQETVYYRLTADHVTIEQYWEVLKILPLAEVERE